MVLYGYITWPMTLWEELKTAGVFEQGDNENVWNKEGWNNKKQVEAI
jgi:hypothetical protein